MNEIEIQRKVLKDVIKKVISRIKDVQTEGKNAYSQEDVWIKAGVEAELISMKISLEKWRKKLKYLDDEKL